MILPVLQLQSKGRALTAQSPSLLLMLQFSPDDAANLAQVSKDMHTQMDPCTKAFLWKTKGNNHLPKGQYDSAIQCYSKAIEQWPKNPTLYSNQALAQLKVCAYGDALISIASAVRLGGLNAKLLYRKSQAFYGLERWEDAVDCSLHAGKLKPNDKAIKKQIEKCAAKLTGYEEQQTKQDCAQDGSAKQEMWKCENLCGFIGSYGEVVAHESCCTATPASAAVAAVAAAGSNAEFFSAMQNGFGAGSNAQSGVGYQSGIEDITDCATNAPVAAEQVVEEGLQHRMFSQYPGIESQHN
jgi:tetratricopeptide (TPR) repeat protein